MIVPGIFISGPRYGASAYNPYNPGTGRYVVPVTGIYRVQARMTRYVYIGREIVRNSKKKWWAFWRDEYVWKDRYEPVEEYNGVEIKRLNAGERIDVCFERL